MAAPDNERQLLLALLAFQNNFIDRAALLAAFDAWSQDKSSPVAEVLVRNGKLSHDERLLLEGLVEKHLARFQGDVFASLAHISAVDSSVRDELKHRTAGALEASLAIVGKNVDPFATAPMLGESTSEGARFRILRPHARGGLGEVFVAVDGELDREVALKRIQDRHADDAESRARFMQEAEITGKLEHPSIVPVYGLGTYDNGRPFYAMRFIRGDSLHDAVRRHYASNSGTEAERSVEFRKLLQRFIDVCNAVEYAHSRGVLHRDLKPGNIMLGKYGETLVVDWGLAKVTGAASSDVTRQIDEGAVRTVIGEGSGATAYGSAVGTPGYMSPEQAFGKLDSLGPQSDVYGLGATLYYVLTGKPPFEGTDLGAVLRQVQAGEFPPPRRLNPQVPRPLEAICLQAMALRPDKRYASAAGLAADIERWLADEPTTAYSERPTERAARWTRTHRTAVVAAVALMSTGIIALALGLVAVDAEQRKTERQRELAEQQRQAAESQRQIAEILAAEKSKLADENADLAVRERDARAAAEESLRQVQTALVYAETAAYAGKLAIAQDQMDKLDFLAARETLASCPQQFRHVEWRCLMARYKQRIPEFKDARGLNVENSLRNLVYDRDGSVMFTLGVGIDEWDTKGRTHTKHLADTAGAMLECSDDGNLIWIAEPGQKSRLVTYDRHSGAKLAEIALSGIVGGVCVLEDGTKLVVLVKPTSQSSYLEVVDAKSLRSLARNEIPESFRIATDRRKRIALSKVGNGILSFFDGDLRSSGELDVGFLNANLAFNDDGSRLIVSSAKNCSIWDVALKSRLTRIDFSENFANFLATDREGRFIAVTDNHSTVRLWDSRAGTERVVSRNAQGSLYALRFTPDGKTLVIARKMGLEFVETTESVIAAPRFGTQFSRIDTLKQGVFAARYVNDLSLLERNGKVIWLRKIDLSKLNSERGLKLGYTPAKFPAQSGDGRWVACGMGCLVGDNPSPGSIVVFDAKTGKEVVRLFEHDDDVAYVAFSRDGERMASLSADGVVRLWNTKTWTSRKLEAGELFLPNNRHIGGLEFSADGKSLAIGGTINNKTVGIWDIDTDKLRCRWADARILRYAPDGRTVLCYGIKGDVQWRDSESGAVVSSVPVSDVFDANVTNDGKRLLFSSSDTYLRIMDIETRQILLALPLNSGRSSVELGRNDDWFVTLGLVIKQHDAPRKWDSYGVVSPPLPLKPKPTR